MNWKQKSLIALSCPPRQQHVLADELRTLHLEPVKIRPTSVELMGTLEDCMRLNLSLRTGNKVLYLLHEFMAGGPDQLHQRAGNIPWEDVVAEGSEITIDAFVRNEHIRDFRFASMRLKDAITDRMLSKKLPRPKTGGSKEGCVLFLYWVEDMVRVYIDTSGQSIAKHGYRTEPYKAPLQEALAASLLLSTTWNKQSNVVNPMCGSGTIAIEAALMATHKAPGLLRQNFGFMHVKGYQPALWQDYCKSTRSVIRPRITGRIIATDHSQEALDAAQQNARQAGVEALIEFKKCDFKDTPAPRGGGIVMLNPEYGERLGDHMRLKEVYPAIGDFFKQKCAGYWAYVFTGNLELGKTVGLKTNQKMEFYNGKIDCRLLEYELFEGTKRRVVRHKTEDDSEQTD